MEASQNPYASPSSEKLQADDNTMAETPRVFAFSGRLGRMRFFTYLALATIGVSIVGSLAMVALSLVHEYLGIAAYAIAMIGSVVFSFSVYIRRLHDINASGWWSALLLLPIVAGIAATAVAGNDPLSGASAAFTLLGLTGLIVLALFLLLLFKPGNRESNHFGAPTTPNSTGVIVGFILTLVFGGIYMIGIVAAISIPAYQDYMERAAQSQNQ